MRPLTLLLAALMLLAAPAAWAQDDEAIGYVKTVSGEAAIERGGSQLAATPGTPVYREDILRTGADGTLGVTLKDSTRLSLGGNSELALREYAFVPSDNQLGFVARLTRGTLLYVSGIIAKLSADSVAVETPVATIAVRGTRFLVRVEE
jgi:hypothetical protein